MTSLIYSNLLDILSHNTDFNSELTKYEDILNKYKKNVPTIFTPAIARYLELETKTNYNKSIHQSRNKNWIVSAYNTTINNADPEIINSFWTKRSINTISESKVLTQTSKTNTCIIGLGKIGSDELNLSSDVDLIIISNDKLFPAKELIKELSSNTQFGKLYTIDMDLRPHGKRSPLVVTPKEFEKYVNYYSDFWYTLALKRSQLVWGDKKLYQSIKKNISSKLYPKYISNSVLSEFSSIISKNRNQNNIGNNLKLMPYGIRECDLFVYLHKYLQKDSVENKNFYSLVEKIDSLSNLEKNSIKSYYKKLRFTENYLMSQNDTTEYKIDEEIKNCLKRQEGYSVFKEHLAKCMEVNDLFKIKNIIKKPLSNKAKILTERYSYQNSKVKNLFKDISENYPFLFQYINYNENIIEPLITGNYSLKYDSDINFINSLHNYKYILHTHILLNYLKNKNYSEYTKNYTKLTKEIINSILKYNRIDFKNIMYLGSMSQNRQNYYSDIDFLFIINSKQTNRTRTFMKYSNSIGILGKLYEIDLQFTKNLKQGSLFILQSQLEQYYKNSPLWLKLLLSNNSLGLFNKLNYTELELKDFITIVKKVKHENFKTNPIKYADGGTFETGILLKIINNKNPIKLELTLLRDALLEINFNKKIAYSNFKFKSYSSSVTATVENNSDSNKILKNSAQICNDIYLDLLS